MSESVAPTPVSGAKKGVSLASFILGIVSVALFWTTILGAIIGLVAVILGFVARAREKGAPRWMAILGIVLGFVGIIIAVILLVAAAALVNNGTVPSN